MKGFELQFRVDSLPVAQPRPRIVMPHRHSRPMAVSAVSGHPVHEFKSCVRQAARCVYDGDPMDLALFLSIEFWFPRPSNKRWKTKAMPREWKRTRPDLDNLVKGVKDALNGIIWTDDSCVVDMRCSKLLVAGTQVEGRYQCEPIGCDVIVREASKCA